MALKKLRKKIDNIDKDIIEQLNERAQLTLEIGRHKTKNNKKIYAPAREKEVYQNILKLNKGPLSNDSLEAIYREVMSASLALEKKIKIAYLGPPATFTHLASLSKFGASLEYLSCENINDVFRDVEKGRADYGVVPIENSTEGAITYTLDMFVNSDLKICSEILFEISHNLISNSQLKKITKIYSKAEVFGQCRLWLERNLPKAQLIDMASTTAAAKKAKNVKNSAAIASELAAEVYGLKIVSSSIEDSSNNVTRFLVIGKNEVPFTGNDKTSIVFSVKDKVGVLYDMLAPFKKNKINLTKIESRPSKKDVWKYYFFIDFEGHHEDNKIKKALEELAKHCDYLKILGSYPKSDLKK
jgi:chorismate mutase/prephenate dehydratase